MFPAIKWAQFWAQSPLSRRNGNHWWLDACRRALERPGCASDCAHLTVLGVPDASAPDPHGNGNQRQTVYLARHVVWARAILFP